MVHFFLLVLITFDNFTSYGQESPPFMNMQILFLLFREKIRIASSKNHFPCWSVSGLWSSVSICVTGWLSTSSLLPPTLLGECEIVEGWHLQRSFNTNLNNTWGPVLEIKMCSCCFACFDSGWTSVSWALWQHTCAGLCGSWLLLGPCTSSTTTKSEFSLHSAHCVWDNWNFNTGFKCHSLRNHDYQRICFKLHWPSQT